MEANFKNITKAYSSPLSSEVGLLSEKIAGQYLDSIFFNDIEAILSNYTNKSILITLGKTYRGIDEISLFMKMLISHLSRKNTVLMLDRLFVEDELAYIVWHGQSSSMTISMASDTFIFNHGKISQHTFVGQILQNDTIT